MSTGSVDGADGELCGRCRPKWLETAPLVVSRLPCVRPAGHEGPHEDAIWQTWVELPPELVYAVAVACVAEQLRRAFADSEAAR
ncbi:hypothetical protein GL263_14950 [Streptomyces durbertensis]|uniref:Uncharacterized protein n=1 Tax=Streptomyces durbertensis TaxID=2448886 RepID=A0ABR6EHN6_9ACTN|nr:hypothetical protein [Streptomyces durbertensis]MBB1244852.1 hypothetical protein [Streptomyces durbertensis]